ncbi:GNAT family N-acetyltransferase [Ruegeria sp. HKCCA5426]|uniref:GNAT family N-acetyltransferase n=1 Tax=Ruegeria sp. HKCCA5426 TaxID=2682985 RepID=UPI001488598B|nr:GNAT family N-acetyltransferase [Ruegeria sp. HKCCA5426]
MSEITLRKATLADVGKVTNCLAAAYAPALRDIPDLPDVTGGVADDIRSHGGVVAEMNAEIVGYIVFGQVDDAVMIFNLAVAPNAQGRGIAGRLLDQAESVARDRGISRLTLRTHRLMHSTVSMYQHLGWNVEKQSENRLLLSKPISKSP